MHMKSEGVKLKKQAGDKQLGTKYNKQIEIKYIKENGGHGVSAKTSGGN